MEEQTERTFFKVDPRTVRQEGLYKASVVADGYERGELFNLVMNVPVANAILSIDTRINEKELNQRGVNIDKLTKRIRARREFFRTIDDPKPEAMQKLGGVSKEVLNDWETVHPEDKGMVVLGVSANTDGMNRVTYDSRMIAVWRRQV